MAKKKNQLKVDKIKTEADIVEEVINKSVEEVKQEIVSEIKEEIEEELDEEEIVESDAKVSKDLKKVRKILSESKYFTDKIKYNKFLLRVSRKFSVSIDAKELISEIITESKEGICISNDLKIKLWHRTNCRLMEPTLVEILKEAGFKYEYVPNKFVVTKL